MRIGELAKAADVGVETVRFYERQGLIGQPLRPVNGGFRSYTPENVSRLRFIRQAQELGFSLNEIQDLLSLKSDPKTDCREVRNRALEKRADVEAKIEKLERIRATLTTLIDACPGEGALEFCAILEGLETGKRAVSKTNRSKGNGK